MTGIKKKITFIVDEKLAQRAREMMLSTGCSAYMREAFEQELPKMLNKPMTIIELAG